MALNFSTLVYLPCQDTFARSAFFTPLVSQPGQPGYWKRGIYNKRPVTVETEVGFAILSDHETIFDIREEEFPVLPKQGDQINIPEDDAGNSPRGNFEITDVIENGGGEYTLVIRKLVTP